MGGVEFQLQDLVETILRLARWSLLSLAVEILDLRASMDQGLART